MERSIKAQIKGFDVEFHILNKIVYLMHVELSYVVLKSWEKMQFCQLKFDEFNDVNLKATIYLYNFQ